MPVLTEELARFKAHRWQISCLDFSPDGSLLASGAWDKEVHLWDLSNLEAVHTLKGAHDVPITCVSWHRPNGLLVCTGSADNTLALWNTESGQNVATLAEHFGWVLGCSFSNSGTLLATASWDKTVRIWDANTATLINNLNGHAAGVWSVEFHPKSSTLCSASEDGTIKLWDPRVSTVVRTFSGGHTDAVYCAKWSPDGAMVASGSADTNISVWEPGTGTVINTIYGHEDTVKNIYFNPNTRNVAVPVLASAGDFTVRLSDPRPTQKADILTLLPHLPGKEVEAVCISPDGSLVVSGGRDGLIVVMNLFVPTIIPESEQPSLSSAIRNSRAFRDRSYIYDATADDISEMNFNSEEDLLAALEIDELDKILEKPGDMQKLKGDEHDASRLSKLKRKSRLGEKAVDLGDHATLKRKGPSARESREKRVKEKLVDVPTMVAHLSAVNRASYAAQEKSSSSETESEEEESSEEDVVDSRHDLLVNISDRVANFSERKRKTTLQEVRYRPPPQRLSLLPDQVPGELKNRREMFEKKPEAAQATQSEDGSHTELKGEESKTQVTDDKVVEGESVYTADGETEQEFLNKYGHLMPGGDESEVDTMQRTRSSDAYDTESLMHESGHYSIKPDYLNTSLQGLEFGSPTHESTARNVFSPSLAPPSEHDEEEETDSSMTAVEEEDDDTLSVI